MRLLHRASPWRRLFAADAVPDPMRLPGLLAPLREVVERLGPAPTLAEARAWQADLLDALLRLELPASRISQLLSDHNDGLYRRAIAESLTEMRGQGWGEPPVAFCVLTLGSAARHESLLAPDQDNAMILADYPDRRHTEIDAYFQSLGERFTQRLDAAGIPLCQGHVMARWPMWRKRRSEWDAQLAIWTGERRVKRVQQANILLDFHPVHGDPALARALGESVARHLPPAGGFLDEMATLLEESPLALDRWGRVVGGGEGAPHQTAVDLKHRALLPLVGAVRLLAVRHRIRAVATRERLAALVMAGALDAQRADETIRALERLQALLLEAQRTALAQGRAPDGWVGLDGLGEGRRLLLRHDLGRIRDLVRYATKR
ncbi:DUF294 nucleotidyltransferase-like domain-containing protein [Halomonas beimenensis]|uniref:Putative signal-transduction protein containing cAMP-binding and CBS domains n=1 Tax=Halomonas beimenensis TaxID=475662 RepID=A0A291P6M4_9GAMM|nr:DUF294 nucleotidyltransferase-like domain-containing protein [Halomonas beimenensis]ATJ82566.1 putative signal-transduction protein containing cAMP-binding and CBS domains [Halomonas beimenensis]